MGDPASPLASLAAAAGLCVDWTDGAGEHKRVAPDSLRAVLAALGWPAADDRQSRESLRALRDAETQATPTLLTADAGQPIAAGGTPGARYQLRLAGGAVSDGRFDAEGRVAGVDAAGYHQLEWRERVTTLAVAPPTCFGMAEACGEPDPRRWGVGLQVYSARDAEDGGVGDASGALAWVERLAKAGGDALALSPLHAARLDASHASPYSPGDRRFLDPVHAAPALVTGAAFADAAREAAGISARFDTLSASALVDWSGVRQARWDWLRALHARRAELPVALQADLATFVRERGPSLQHYARVAAGELEGEAGEDGASLQRFAQWLAARSWSAVQARAQAAGMRPGLIADLAVGFDPGGSEARAWPDAVLRGLTLGAPPDAFDAGGQAWGIGSYAPAGLRRHGFAPFLELLRAVMRDRGGVRIDHILGLMRLWVVPDGAGSDAGVYLRQPFDDLLRLLVLESRQQRAVIV
ncbi:MAG TPA: 4-alpha-glucanotransferase, partial [Luteimonas sp.]|nr:4-alpha-glucanotransferase [Luteimonas sp.]